MFCLLSATLLILCYTHVLAAPEYPNAQANDPAPASLSTVNLTPPRTNTIVSIVTPSPSATPVTVTQQSQLVKSYIATLTSCTVKDIATVSVIDCTTFYSTTLTPICHTTLHPLGNVPVIVSDCAQHLTFSSEQGLSTRVDQPSAQCALATTIYVAKWDQFTDHDVPQGTITAKVCGTASNDCTTSYESWRRKSLEATKTSLVTMQWDSVVTGYAT